MNWSECAAAMESEGRYPRLAWPLGEGRAGFDCNPDAATASDVTGAAAWILTWPGDYILSRPAVRSFMEMGPDPVAGSGWAWVLVIFAFLMLGAIQRN
jgi:hypothetical protein